MAKLVINDNLLVNGKLSFERALNEEGTAFIIQGVLSTHLYFDDIEKIDSNRFTLDGVEVYKETFGSDDYNILYHFTAKQLEVLGYKQNGATYLLYGEEMKMIEDEMYKDEHPILGDIGKEYKDMYKEDDEEEKEE